MHKHLYLNIVLFSETETRKYHKHNISSFARKKSLFCWLENKFESSSSVLLLLGFFRFEMIIFQSQNLFFSFISGNCKDLT